MDEKLKAAVDLFNDGRFSDFQDAMEGLTSTTRAASERQFYALLNNLAESLLQLSDGDVQDAEERREAKNKEQRLRAKRDSLPRSERGSGGCAASTPQLIDVGRS